jgi:amino acid transporter
MGDHGASGKLLRVLTTRDVVLFLVVATISPRWIARAAAAGPGAILLWIVAGAAFFLPLSLAVYQLTLRRSGPGGLYAWTAEAFGERVGFLTGWTYWASNIVYFPGLLYFAAGNALHLMGAAGAGWDDSPAYYVTAAGCSLLLAVLLHLRGMGVGRWLTNAGGTAGWAVVLLVMAVGAFSWLRFGSATSFSRASLDPRGTLGDVSLFAALAFAYSGVEAVSFLREEMRDPARALRRGLWGAGAAIAGIYVLATLALLAALPAAEASGIEGLVQAIERASTRLGMPGLAPLAAALLVVATLGGVGAWLSSVARLPYAVAAAGWLPASLARVHPRLGVPHVALGVQAGGAFLFALLGQAGETVEGAYDMLVNLAVVVTFLPYLALFAAHLRLLGSAPAEEAGATHAAWRAISSAASILGLLTTLLAMGVALAPAEGGAGGWLATAKILLGTGAILLLGAALRAGQRHAGTSPAR